MSCNKHVMGIHWQHHTWRPRVTFAEVITSPDANMWGRTVEREYVRCDKREVCSECGTVGREWSCICDVAEGEECLLRQDWIRDNATPRAAE
jgi:hypothetical protein